MNRIDDLLDDVNSIAITGHVRPDGDCVGSVMALYTYLVRNYPDIKTDVYLEKFSDKLKFIVYTGKIDSSYKSDKTYDLMFCLDSASLERIGEAQKFFRTAKHTVNIDHHVSNPQFADENYVYGDASSACEVLYDFLDPEKIDRDIAIALYTGIIYDTAVFKYPSTSPHTMEIAAELLRFNIPTNFIIDESFYAKTYDENRIFGYAVLNSSLHFGGKVITSYISTEKINEFKVSRRELEGIVPQLLLTKDVVCAVFMTQMADDNHSNHGEEAPARWKISLRSRGGIDVNEIAALHGGGGHVRASGCSMSGSIDEVRSQLLKEIGTRLGLPAEY